MATRITPSNGGKPDKLITDALRIELLREAEKGKPTKKLQLLVKTVVDKAIDGDMTAAAMVWNRLEGMPSQSSTITQDVGQTYLEALRIVAERDKANGSSAKVIEHDSAS